jgi:hypothetical protein
MYENFSHPSVCLGQGGLKAAPSSHAEPNHPGRLDLYTGRPMAASLCTMNKIDRELAQAEAAMAERAQADGKPAHKKTGFRATVKRVAKDAALRRVSSKQ